MRKSIQTLCVSVAAVLFAAAASAQTPVIDNANLRKAQEIATTTNSILAADRQIMQFTQKTLAAVTGDRTSQAGQLSQIALGGGSFSMGGAPSLGSVISGGSLSFAGMGGGSQNIVSGLIKAGVFGFIIALMGCYHGFNSKGGAQGVGNATTSAVVSSSILILAANYLLTSLLFSK